MKATVTFVLGSVVAILILVGMHTGRDRASNPTRSSKRRNSARSSLRSWIAN